MATRPLKTLTTTANPAGWLAEVKLAVRYNLGAAEDAAFNRYLSTARELFELRTGRPVLPATFRQWFGSFDALELVRGDVLGVEAVTYLDADQAEQDLDGWQLDAAELPAVVYLPGGGYPAVTDRRRLPVWVDYTAGYPNEAAIPAAVVTAVQLVAAHLYRFREATTEAALKELPIGFGTICDLFDTGLTRAV